jgi:uncharacterized OB-fold protein
MSDATTADEWTKPLPQPDDVNRAYWNAAVEGRLVIQQCPHCSHRQFYPRALCTQCGEPPDWMECTGRGTVHTFTIIRQMGMRPFRDELPYVVAMIELEEGPLIMGNVTDCDPGAVQIGAPVEVHFVRATDDVSVPYWRLAS